MACIPCHVLLVISPKFVCQATTIAANTSGWDFSRAIFQLSSLSLRVCAENWDWNSRTEIWASKTWERCTRTSRNCSSTKHCLQNKYFKVYTIPVNQGNRMDTKQSGHVALSAALKRLKRDNCASVCQVFDLWVQAVYRTMFHTSCWWRDSSGDYASHWKHRLQVMVSVYSFWWKAGPCRAAWFLLHDSKYMSCNIHNVKGRTKELHRVSAHPLPGVTSFQGLQLLAKDAVGRQNSTWGLSLTAWARISKRPCRPWWAFVCLECTSTWTPPGEAEHFPSAEQEINWTSYSAVHRQVMSRQLVKDIPDRATKWLLLFCFDCNPPAIQTCLELYVYFASYMGYHPPQLTRLCCRLSSSKVRELFAAANASQWAGPPTFFIGCKSVLRALLSMTDQPHAQQSKALSVYKHKPQCWVSPGNLLSNSCSRGMLDESMPNYHQKQSSRRSIRKPWSKRQLKYMTLTQCSFIVLAPQAVKATIKLFRGTERLLRRRR